MLERLFDLIIDIWEWLLPFEVIDQYEDGVVLRWGVYKRKVGPGFRWIWPLGVEAILKETVVRTTSYLDVQSLTTRDGKKIQLTPILVYKIGNIKRWLLEVDDAEEALHDVTYGLIDEQVSLSNLEDVLRPDFEKVITELVQHEGVTWGARVEAVKFADRQSSRSLRLWNDG